MTVRPFDQFDSLLLIENLKLVSRLRQQSQELEAAHAGLLKLHYGRTRFVCNLSHKLKTHLTPVSASAWRPAG